MPSNLAARDVETLVHPYTNLATLPRDRPARLERGKGVWVYDARRQPYLEGMAGLWCTALGYSNEELVEAAARADAPGCRSRTCSRAAATIRRSSSPRS